MWIDRKPRIYKPATQQIELDRSHPLARSLAFAAVFTGGGPASDLVGGYGSTPTNSPQSLNTAEAGYGAGCDFPASGSAYQNFSGTTSDTAYIGDISIIWRGIVRTGSAFRNFCQKTSGNGTANNPFEFRTDNSATPFMQIVRSSAGGSNSVISSQSFSLGAVHSLGIAAKNDNVTDPIFYVDGVGAAAAATFTQAPFTGSGNPIWVGRRPDGAVQMDGVCLHCYIWSRIITANEFMWIAKEPYAFVRPKASIKVPTAQIAATAKFRRTLSPVGTRTGSRQVQGWT